MYEIYIGNMLTAGPDKHLLSFGLIVCVIALRPSTDMQISILPSVLSKYVLGNHTCILLFILLHSSLIFTFLSTKPNLIL